MLTAWIGLGAGGAITARTVSVAGDRYLLAFPSLEDALPLSQAQGVFGMEVGTVLQLTAQSSDFAGLLVSTSESAWATVSSETASELLVALNNPSRGGEEMG